MVRYASEGERIVEVAINSRVHVLAWLTEGLYRTGEWDAAVDTFATVPAPSRCAVWAPAQRSRSRAT